MFKQDFSERLAQLRMGKNVSARKMSLDLGQSPGYINSIENKNSMPSMEVFHNICDYLKIRPQDFFDYDNVHPERVGQITENTKKLNAKQLEILSSIIEEFLKSNMTGKK